MGRTYPQPPRILADPATEEEAARRGYVDAGLAGKADDADVVPLALVDAKADLLVGSGPDTVARLGVGVDGQVLTADAAAPVGVRWAAPTGGSGTTINGTGYRTGAVPAGSTLPVIQHDLGTRALSVVVQDTTTGLIVPVAAETVDDTGALSLNHVRLTFDAIPTAGQWTYTILAGAPVASQVVPVPPVPLLDAATIATDASAGVHFRLAAMTGDRTLGVPTAPTDGQRGLWEITAAGAQRVLTLAQGVQDGFEPTLAAPAATVTIPAGEVGFVGAIYSTARRRWAVMGVTRTGAP